MTTKLSSKGQVVLPQSVRRKLGLVAGESLAVRVEHGRIVLARTRSRAPKARIASDSVTGLPVLDTGKKAGQLTSDQVAAVLADFP
jgi:AbrB family looped-hinge helix DNA binding protein